MNCRFCGNFVPEGKDSCPVCGRRPDEEPIGKLLSENQPNTAMQTTESAAETAEAAEKSQKHPKGLFLPLLMIGISIAGWAYALIANGEQFKNLLSSLFGGMGLDSGSDYVTGSTASTEFSGLIVYAVVAVALTLLGLAGIAMLIKRLINRAKY